MWAKKVTPMPKLDLENNIHHRMVIGPFTLMDEYDSDGLFTHMSNIRNYLNTLDGAYSVAFVRETIDSHLKENDPNYNDPDSQPLVADPNSDPVTMPVELVETDPSDPESTNDSTSTND